MELPVDHIAIAVPSIVGAQRIFETLAGAAAGPAERVDTQGVNVAFVGSGSTKLELVEPLAPDTPVGRFLAKRGQGIHHIAYRVEDLAATLDRLAEAGFELIDRTPRRGAHGRLVAFVHPRSTAGVLIELVEAG